MADEREDFLEENVAALMRAGYAQPDPETSERVLAMLAADLRARTRRSTSLSEFPDWALVGLAVSFALMAGWFGEQMVAAGASPLSRLPVLAVATLLAVNLILAPVAGAIIVLRRRYVV